MDFGLPDIEGTDEFKSLDTEDQDYVRSEFNNQYVIPNTWDSMVGDDSFTSLDTEDQFFVASEFDKDYGTNIASSWMQKETTPEDRGVGGDIWSSLARGSGKAAEMVGRSLQVSDLDYGDDAGWFDKAGSAIQEFAEDLPKKYETFRPDIAEVEGTDPWAYGKVMEGFQSIPLSLTPFVAAAAGGAVAGPVGAGAAGIGALVQVFGGGSYHEKRSELSKVPGLTAEQIHSGSFKHAAIETVGEIVNDVILVGIGKALPGVNTLTKAATRDGIKKIMQLGPKQIGAAFGKTYLAEWGTETAQHKLQTDVGYDLGINEKVSVLESAVETAIPTAIVSLSFGLVGGTYAANEKRKLLNGLNSGNKDIREQAQGTISADLRKKDPEIAQAWDTYTIPAIDNGQPISITEDFTVKPDTTEILGAETVEDAIDTFDKSVATDEGQTPDITINPLPMSKSVEDSYDLMEAELLQTNDPSWLSQGARDALGGGVDITAAEARSIIERIREKMPLTTGQAVQADYLDKVANSYIQKQIKQEDIIYDVDLSQPVQGTTDTIQVGPIPESTTVERLTELSNDPAKLTEHVESELGRTLTDEELSNLFPQEEKVDPDANIPEEMRPGINALEESLRDIEGPSEIIEGKDARVSNETRVIGKTPATSPEWFKNATIKKYDKTHGTEYAKDVNQESVATTLRKVREGKPLTDRQQRVWEYIQVAEQQQSTPEVETNRQLTKLEGEGFEFTEAETIPVGNMKKGDEVVVLDELGVPDKLTHKGRDKETGDIVLEDGQKLYVDEFDTVDAIAQKKAPEAQGTTEVQVESDIAPEYVEQDIAPPSEPSQQEVAETVPLSEPDTKVDTSQEVMPTSEVQKDAAEPTTADQITKAIDNLGKGMGKAAREEVARNIEAGKTDRLTLRRPEAVAAAKQNENYNIKDNADGSVTVIGVKGQDGWVGVDPAESVVDKVEFEALEGAGAKVEKSPDNKTLVAVHNLSGSNLLHSDKELGGNLPVPSVGITKKDEAIEGFGEISLIAKKDLVDPKVTATTKVFGGDAYTPRYPETIADINEGAFSEYTSDFNKSSEVIGGRKYDDYEGNLSRGTDRLGDMPSVKYTYLKSVDAAPRVKTKSVSFPLADFNPNLKNYYGKDYFDLVTDKQFIADVRQATIKKAELMSGARRDMWLEKAENLDRDFLLDKARTASVYTTKKSIDYYATKDAIDKRINQRKHKKGFNEYLETLGKKVISGQKIFKGFTPSGARKKYIPASLENIIKEMKRNTRGGESFNYGLNSIKAQKTPQFKSIAQLKKQEGRLLSGEEFQKVWDEISEEYNELTPGGVHGNEAMMDAAKYGDYNYVNNPEAVREFFQKLRNMPSKYFEAKLNRAVPLSEFSVAVVPKGTSKEVLDTLRKHDIKIRYHKKGDKADRRKVVGSLKDMFFALEDQKTDQDLLSQVPKGEQQAMQELLGKTEEVTETSTLGEQLRKAKQSKSSPITTKLAKFLEQVIPDSKLDVKVVIDPNARAPMYNSETGVITLKDPAKHETSLHEIVHAVTVGEMEANPEVRARVSELFKRVKKELIAKNIISASDIKAIEEAGGSKAFKALYKGDDFGGLRQIAYAMLNENEFLSQAFSSPEFQGVLKSIPVQKRGWIDNMWDVLVSGIMKALGIPQGQHNAFSEVLRLTAELAQTDATGKGKGAFEAPGISNKIYLRHKEGQDNKLTREDGKYFFTVDQSYGVNIGNLRSHLFRYIDDFLSPLDDNIYIRTTNNKEDINHLKSGKHKGSVNHATGESEGGLSVSKSLELPGKYVYYVKGSRIGEGTDGEPLLDIDSVEPTSELMLLTEFRKDFKAKQSNKNKELSLTDEESSQLRANHYLVDNRNEYEALEDPVTYEDTKGPVTPEDYDDNFSQDRNIKGKVLSGASGVLREVGKGLDKVLGSISTRLANIEESLKFKLRRHYMDISDIQREYMDQVLPLLEKAKKGMNARDVSEWDYARKNSDKVKIKELITKHDLQTEYDSYREALDKLRQEALEVGYEVGLIDEYAPRILKDAEGFLKAIGKDYRRWPAISRAIQERAHELGISEKEMTKEMKADMVSNLLYGGPQGKAAPGSTKKRKIDKIPSKLNKFYMDSDAALTSHIHGMVKAIESRKFFGKVPKRITETKTAKHSAEARLRKNERQLAELDAVGDEASSKKADKIRERNNDITSTIIRHKNTLDRFGAQSDFSSTIGHYVWDLVEQGKIKPDDQQTLIDILSAAFNPKQMSGLWLAYKNFSYIDTMGSYTSAATQIGDQAWSLFDNGLIPTIKNDFKSLVGKSRISKEETGFDRIGEEFSDPGKLSKAVAWVFKAIGLEKMDTIGKETLINGAIEKYEMRAQNDEIALRKELKPMFEGSVDSVIDSLKAKEITADTKFLGYSKLLDFQPAAPSEMTQKYLELENGKIFYMLKTFTLKQFDIFRNISYNKIKNGTRSEKIQGLQNLVKMSILFMLANAGADEIKDWMLGRETDLEDRVVDNLLRLFGVSKYVTWKARTEGVGSAMSRQILPPFKFIDSVGKDLIKFGDGKGLEVLGSVPILGKLAYWHLGRGTSKRGDLWDRRLSKKKKKLNAIKDRVERNPELRKKYAKDLRTLKQVNKLQGKLNKYRKQINKLKAKAATSAGKKMIQRLEETRTNVIKRYLGE